MIPPERPYHSGTECRQATFYRHRVLTFWREHPAEKVRLAGQATLMLWNPKVSPSDTGEVATSNLNRVRASIEPVYTTPIFLFALVGLAFVPRRFAVLAATLLGYQWAVAAIFVGATRYRVPWDFIPALARDGRAGGDRRSASAEKKRAQRERGGGRAAASGYGPVTADT